MQARVVVEVSDTAEGGGASLLRAAYRASRKEPILLLLRGVERSEANRILDPVVSSTGVAVWGVRYLLEPEREKLTAAASSVRWIVTSRAGNGGTVREHGPRLLDIEEGMKLLHSITQDSAPVEV